MFGIGFPELIIILVVALIVFGPKKLPELAKALGKGMAEFRKATHEIKESLDLNEDLQSVRKDIADSITGLDRPEANGAAEKVAEETAFKKATDEIKQSLDLNEDLITGPDRSEARGQAEKITDETAEPVGHDQPLKEVKKEDPALVTKDDHVR